MRDRQPGWCDENVLRLPFERRVADACATATFDGAINAAVGRAVRSSVERLRQQLNECADRRHRRSAARWVDVLHLEAMTRMPRFIAAHPLERLARPGVGIREDRRRQ